MQTYVDSLVRHFVGHSPQLGDEYKWPRGKNAISYDETFARRVRDSQRFATEPACRTALAIEMIKWGGITRGLDEVPSMANETPQQLITRGLTRVATWSKILTLHDPAHYLIYDARVAFSLNHIFYTAGLTGSVFPMISSRNTHIVRALAVLHSRGVRLKFQEEAGAPSFYQTYLELARGTAENLGIPAWQIEMVLFARGPELAKSVSTK
jgi:hypothetical protein